MIILIHIFLFIAYTSPLWLYIAFKFASEPAPSMTLKQANPQPDSMWLVVVECRYNVIHVSIDGTGFFIPGQEPCWGLDHAAEWLYEIKTPM